MHKAEQQSQPPYPLPILVIHPPTTTTNNNNIEDEEKRSMGVEEWHKRLLKKHKPPNIIQEVLRSEAITRLEHEYKALCETYFGWKTYPKTSFGRWLCERYSGDDSSRFDPLLPSTSQYYQSINDVDISRTITREICEDFPAKLIPPYDYVQNIVILERQIEQYHLALLTLRSHGESHCVMTGLDDLILEFEMFKDEMMSEKRLDVKKQRFKVIRGCIYHSLRSIFEPLAVRIAQRLLFMSNQFAHLLHHHHHHHSDNNNDNGDNNNDNGDDNNDYEDDNGGDGDDGRNELSLSSQRLFDERSAKKVKYNSPPPPSSSSSPPFYYHNDNDNDDDDEDDNGGGNDDNNGDNDGERKDVIHKLERKGIIILQADHHYHHNHSSSCKHLNCIFTSPSFQTLYPNYHHPQTTSIELNNQTYQTLKHQFLSFTPPSSSSSSSSSFSSFSNQNNYETMETMYVYMWTLLKRYTSFLQGDKNGSLHAAVPSSLFEFLHEKFEVKMECFASPFNNHFERYCSAFEDVDVKFGSVGSFFSFFPIQGSFEANPPFCEVTMERMVRHMVRLIESTSLPLSFIIFLPNWVDNETIMELKERCKYVRTCVMAKANSHQYDVSKHAVIPPKSKSFFSVHDTCIFFLQNDAAHQRWIVTDDLKHQLLLAFQNHHHHNHHHNHNTTRNHDNNHHNNNKSNHHHPPTLKRKK